MELEQQDMGSQWSRLPETAEAAKEFAQKRAVMLRNWFVASLKSKDPDVCLAAAQFEAFDLAASRCGARSLVKQIREAK
ncbi:MAG: hypothetical protein NW202_13435 [Nitrospira sp.]|nr:hypothetical protein [Nitrospira sp.]